MIVDDRYQSKAMFAAAINPAVPWLRPPEIDANDDYVYTRGLTRWRAGALMLAITDDTYTPEPKVVTPMEDCYSALTLAERRPAGFNRIHIIADRDKPFGFDNPDRVVSVIKLGELLLLQEQKMQALLKVKKVAHDLEGAVQSLKFNSDEDGGVFDGVAVVEEIVANAVQSVLPERFVENAQHLAEHGVALIEGPGPGFGITLDPRHIVQSSERASGYFAA